MRKDRIYLEDTASSLISDPFLVHKLKNVLRKKKGDEVFVFDGRGKQFSSRIEKVAKAFIELGPLELLKSVPRRPVKVALSFSLLRASKVDFLLQKAAELGIDRFIPFISCHSAVSLPGRAKTIHWSKVLVEACSQSGRLFLPEMEPACKFDDLVKRFKEYDIILIAEPSASKRLDQIADKALGRKKKNILLLAGPEGGFSRSELKLLEGAKGVSLVRISDFILRAETAAIFLAGLAIHYIGKDRD